MLSPTMTLLAWNCFLNSRFSLRSRLASIAFFSTINVLSIDNGFSRKSNAPSLVARTAVSMLPCPEIMMTSGWSSFSTSFSSVARPSTPGNQISSRTTSTDLWRRVSMHSSPLSASSALYPSSSSTPCSELRIWDSSSTIRMVCILLDWVGHFGGHWQLYDKSSSHGGILFYPNRPVMIFHNTADNRETKSGAAFLGGEIRQKKSFLQLRGDAVPGVGDGDLDRIAITQQHGGDIDLLKQRILHGFGGIVHQVGHGAFHGIGIGLYPRQIRCKKPANLNALQTAIEHQQCLINDAIYVGRLRLQCREAGQHRELIHQRAQCIHRRANGFRAMLDDVQGGRVG